MGNSVYPSDTPPTTRLHPLSFPNSSSCQGPSTQIYEPMGARFVKPALVLLFFLESFVLYGQVFCLDVDLYTYHVSAVPVEVRRECWGSPGSGVTDSVFVLVLCKSNKHFNC